MSALFGPWTFFFLNEIANKIPISKPNIIDFIS